MLHDYNYRDYIDTRNKLLASNRIDKNEYPVIMNDLPNSQRLEIISKLMEVFKKYKTAINNETLDNLQEKYKKFLYEDSNFAVITPKTTSEIVSEGEHLHHCVGSYVDRICNGSTNVLFIREKKDIKKPFYTVEISNLGIIQQVYGFGDKVATADVHDFVEKWFKNCDAITDLKYAGR